MSGLLLLAATTRPLEPLVWFGLGMLGAVGLLAVLSPKRFSVLSTRGSQWIDTSKFFAKLDQRVDVDHYFLPYSRLLGGAVLVATALLAALYLRT